MDSIPIPAPKSLEGIEPLEVITENNTQITEQNIQLNDIQAQQAQQDIQLITTQVEQEIKDLDDETMLFKHKKFEMIEKRTKTRDREVGIHQQYQSKLELERMEYQSINYGVKITPDVPEQPYVNIKECKNILKEGKSPVTHFLASKASPVHNEADSLILSKGIKGKYLKIPAMNLPQSNPLPSRERSKRPKSTPSFPNEARSLANEEVYSERPKRSRPSLSYLNESELYSDTDEQSSISRIRSKRSKSAVIVPEVSKKAVKEVQNVLHNENRTVFKILFKKKEPVIDSLAVTHSRRSLRELNPLAPLLKEEIHTSRSLRESHPPAPLISEELHSRRSSRDLHHPAPLIKDESHEIPKRHIRRSSRESQKSEIIFNVSKRLSVSNSKEENRRRSGLRTLFAFGHALPPMPDRDFECSDAFYLILTEYSH